MSSSQHKQAQGKQASDFALKEEFLQNKMSFLHSPYNPQVYHTQIIKNNNSFKSNTNENVDNHIITKTQNVQQEAKTLLLDQQISKRTPKQSVKFNKKQNDKDSVEKGPYKNEETDFSHEQQIEQSEYIQFIKQEVSIKQNQIKKNKNYIKNWEQFCKSFNFNSQYGYLINPIVELQKPQFAEFNSIVQRLSMFKSSSDLQQEIKKCQNISVQSFETTQQMIKFRDMLTYIEGRYLSLERNLGKKDTQIQIPFPLSKYIIEISAKLNIKLGPTAALSSNWGFFKDENTNETSSLDLTMDNLRMKYFFTQHIQQEHIFFGTSIVASFHLTKVLKNCYEINKLIQNDNITLSQKNLLIINFFKEIQQKWNLIYDLMVNLSDKLDAQIYYHQIRPHLMGFEKIKFQNYEGDFTSGGGSAGEDPCYQLFERVMGVQISESFTKIQVKLREGMYKSHTDLQQFFKKNSLIKTYCLKNDQLTEAYQNVLKTYTKMNCFHNVFIKKYILNFVAPENHSYSKGAGGNNIMDIMNRWKVLDEKNSLGMRPHSKKVLSQEEEKKDK